MGAAHGLPQVIVTTGGILSTPAASNLIRQRQATGGIILSASHNPGGPDGDFGVKVNGANGGPTPASFTDAVYDCSKTLEGYSIVDAPAISLQAPGQHTIGEMQVEVIDGVDDFVVLMKQLFDFESISALIRNDFPLAFDAMHAVTGPYAKTLLEEVLGAPAGSVRNGTPLEDFGIGACDRMHGIKGQRKVVANQSADALEVKQLLHQHHEVIDAIDHLDLHLPDRVLSWGLQADSWGVDNRIALKGFAAVVDRIRK
jgi:phosphoglucomutase